MFFEQIATITRDHARTHLEDCLSRIKAQFTDTVALPLPKSFDTASLVGGVAGVSGSTLPAFALNCYDKQYAQDNANLWTYIYSGQVIGMAAGKSADEAEKKTKRYAAALELFIREHEHLPHGTDQPFLIAEMLHVKTTFFGAANVPEGDKALWIDGFQIDLNWSVSENGPSQHL